MAPQIKRATKFNRIFDPEFLISRKDITPLEIAVCHGKMDEFIAAVKADEHVIHNRNRDGNTLLLLAVANVRLELAHLLLEMKSDIHHKNGQKLDALDYACMESCRSAMAKEVISHCDYVHTEAFEGQLEKASKKAIVDLLATGHKMARTALLGKRPDFSSLFGRETDYRKEWVANLKYITQLVRKGLLLLDDDITYLERDALLTGALEIPVQQRYLYSPESQKIVKFTEALRPGSAYEHALEDRLVKTAFEGDSMSVQGLLKGKATPNAQNVRGESVLHCAAHNGDTLTIKCLLFAKAQINWNNREGFTALHVASSRSLYDATTILLRAKADIFARSNKGHSALDFCKHEGHKAVLLLLQDAKDEVKDARAAKAKKK